MGEPGSDAQVALPDRIADAARTGILFSEDLRTESI